MPSPLTPAELDRLEELRADATQGGAYTKWVEEGDDQLVFALPADGWEWAPVADVPNRVLRAYIAAFDPETTGRLLTLANGVLALLESEARLRAALEEIATPEADTMLWPWNVRYYRVQTLARAALGRPA